MKIERMIRSMVINYCGMLCLLLCGATYYVAPNGSDTNPGTETLPWRTIQKAAETLGSGETVLIKAGTYRERVVPRNSGNQYITYASYPGHSVTIDGAGISLPSDMAGLFEVSGLSYIRISGLRIVNAGTGDNHAGILVTDSQHILIEHNATYNTASSGIGVWNSRDVTIRDNEVELCCNDGEQECITVAGTDSFEIRNNHVHHGGPGTIGGEGIDAKDGSANGRIYQNHVHHLNRLGIYLDAWDKHTHHIEVYQNRVHDIANSDGFSLASESGGLLENIRVYNNIAYNNRLSGLSFSAAGEAAIHPVCNVMIVNNTFYNNGSSQWGGGITIENAGARNLVIRNNICSQNRFFQIQVEVPVQNLTVDHNLIDGHRGYESEIYGDDFVEDDPLFVNPSGADFHLRKGSPARDRGSSVDAPSDDFDGFYRPQGAGYDLGAFEAR